MSNIMGIELQIRKGRIVNLRTMGGHGSMCRFSRKPGARTVNRRLQRLLKTDAIRRRKRANLRHHKRGEVVSLDHNTTPPIPTGSPLDVLTQNLLRDSHTGKGGKTVKGGNPRGFNTPVG